MRTSFCRRLLVALVATAGVTAWRWDSCWPGCDYRQRVAVDGADEEVAALAADFNRMAAGLQQSEGCAASSSRTWHTSCVTPLPAAGPGS